LVTAGRRRRLSVNGGTSLQALMALTGHVTPEMSLRYATSHRAPSRTPMTIPWQRFPSSGTRCKTGRPLRPQSGQMAACRNAQDPPRSGLLRPIQPPNRALTPTPANSVRTSHLDESSPAPSSPNLPTSWNSATIPQIRGMGVRSRPTQRHHIERVHGHLDRFTLTTPPTHQRLTPRPRAG
jgi:hypothetical protein